MPTTTDIHLRIRSVMRQRGMTQADLSNDTKILPPNISKLMTGQRPPSVTTLRKVLIALNASDADVRYILNLDGKGV